MDWVTDELRRLWRGVTMMREALGLLLTIVVLGLLLAIVVVLAVLRSPAAVLVAVACSVLAVRAFHDIGEEEAEEPESPEAMQARWDDAERARQAEFLRERHAAALGKPRGWVEL